MRRFGGPVLPSAVSELAGRMSDVTVTLGKCHSLDLLPNFNRLGELAFHLGWQHEDFGAVLVAEVES